MLKEKKFNRSKNVIIMVILAILIALMMTFSTGCNFAEMFQADTNSDEEPVSENSQEPVLSESSIDMSDNIETGQTQLGTPDVKNNEVEKEALNTYTGITKVEQEEMYKYLAGCWYRSDDMTKAMSFTQTPDQAFSYIFTQKENGDINIEKYLDGDRVARFKILYDGDGKYERKFEIMCAYMPSGNAFNEEGEASMEETIWVKSRNSFDYSEEYKKRLRDGENADTSQSAITSPDPVSSPEAISTPEGLSSPEAITSPEGVSTDEGINPSDAAIVQNSSPNN